MTSQTNLSTRIYSVIFFLFLDGLVLSSAGVGKTQKPMNQV